MSNAYQPHPSHMRRQSLSHSNVNPNPQQAPMQQDFPNPGPANIVNYGLVYDPVVIFKKVIDSAAVASAKIICKQNNLANQIESKNQAINTRTFPNHILTKIKALDDPIRTQTGIQILENDVLKITERMKSLTTDLEQVEHDLIQTVEESVKLAPDVSVTPFQIRAVRHAFFQKRLATIADFNVNQRKQDAIYRKRIILATAAQQKAQEKENSLTPKDVKNIVINVLKKQLPKSEHSSKDNSKPRKSKYTETSKKTGKSNNNSPKKKSNNKSKGNKKPNTNKRQNKK
jgi:hypothetical protein